MWDKQNENIKLDQKQKNVVVTLGIYLQKKNNGIIILSKFGNN